MPAMSCPIADIFSDWMSWSCSRRRSVWSSKRSTTAERSVLLIGTARNRIGPLAGAQLDLAARSLLIQSPLQFGSPFGRREGLPGAADQAGGWRVHQVGEGAVGPPDPAPAVHDTERRRDGVHHLLPGPPAVVVQIDQPRALQRDAGLADETLEEGEIRAGRSDPRSPRTAIAPVTLPLAISGANSQLPVGLGLRRQCLRHGATDRGHRGAPAPLGETRARAGPDDSVRVRRPGVQGVLGIHVVMKEGERDLGGREILPHLAQQRIHHRGAPQGTGQLMAERDHPAQQGQVVYPRRAIHDPGERARAV